MLDFIIRGGRVVDGTGAKAVVTDIGVEGDRMIALGDLSKAEARQVMDAAGLVVSPGFIDAHAHSDAYLLIEPDAPSKLAQGITTEINGQCGGSASPRMGPARLSSDWASQHYPTLAGQRAAEPGPTWSTLAEYRALFDAVAPAINTVQFIGHNTLRAGVTGYAPRHATSEELGIMQLRLEQAMDEGGWGLSTGLLYQPGKYGDPAEVLALARTAVRKGGLYASHIRNEGDTLLESIAEVLKVAEETGIQVQISHLKTSGQRNWHKIDAVLAMIDAARAKGIRVQADRYPYLAAGTDLDIVLPEWAASGGREVILDHVRNAATRQRMERELDESRRDWSKVMIGGGWHDEVRSLSGLTVKEAAQRSGLSAGQLVCRCIELDETRTGAFFFGMCEENLRRICAAPWVMPGSDASLRAPWGPLGNDHPHPRAYGTMPRFLRLMTGRLEQGAALLSFEQAIHRMTGLPATTFGIRDRGVIRPGAFADLAIFDEDQFVDRATYAQPHQMASGMRWVMVNGTIAYENGTFTGKRGGRFLTR